MENAREAFVEMVHSLVSIGKSCLLSAAGLVLGFGAGAIAGSVSGALIMFRVGQGNPTNFAFHIGDAGLARISCGVTRTDAEEEDGSIFEGSGTQESRASEPDSLAHDKDD